MVLDLGLIILGGAGNFSMSDRILSPEEVDGNYNGFAQSLESLNFNINGYIENSLGERVDTDYIFSLNMAYVEILDDSIPNYSFYYSEIESADFDFTFNTTLEANGSNIDDLSVTFVISADYLNNFESLDSQNINDISANFSLDYSIEVGQSNYQFDFIGALDNGQASFIISETNNNSTSKVVLTWSEQSSPDDNNRLALGYVLIDNKQVAEIILDIDNDTLKAEYIDNSSETMIDFSEVEVFVEQIGETEENI